ISQCGMDFKRGYMVRGIDHITLPHVDKDFAQRIQKPEYRERLKVALNRTFIQFLMNPYNDIIAKIEYSNILNTFASYSLISEDAKNGTTNPYSSGNQWYDEEIMYQLGFLEYGTYWYFWNLIIGQHQIKTTIFILFWNSFLPKQKVNYRQIPFIPITLKFK